MAAVDEDAFGALFRRESGRLTSILTRILGPQNLDLAEDVVQEAFVAAAREWSERGAPDNPAAWLLTVARRRAVDAIRRERTRRSFAADLALALDSEWTLTLTVDEQFGERWILDDQLRMIFMCCHPGLSLENRVTVILKSLCGFGVPAIARALLASESTINKRLYRARRFLRTVRFEVPPPDELPAALDTVHTALYLLFNEGFLSSSSEPIVREMCRDAMLLTQLLVDESSLANSRTVALLALMCLTTARFDARLDGRGELVPLDEQDRSRWDRELIGRGFAYLARSSRMEAIRASRFHLEAAIAAKHCSAPTFAETDWASICRLYDRLRDVAPSPVVGLNRAVAISYRDGPAAAIPLVEALGRSGELGRGPAVAAVLANLHARAGEEEAARRFRAEALKRTATAHERRLMEHQLERLGGGGG